MLVLKNKVYDFLLGFACHVEEGHFYGQENPAALAEKCSYMEGENDGDSSSIF